MKKFFKNLLTNVFVNYIIKSQNTYMCRPYGKHHVGKRRINYEVP